MLKLDEDEDSVNLFPRRIRKSDIAYATSQLAIMVDTGITLAAALGSLQEQEDHPGLKRILGELKRDVESGEDFSVALGKHPRYFNKTYIALVKASERTGQLGAMLEHIANYLRKELDSVSKVKAAMAYPAIMLVLAVGVTIFLLTYIMPKFTPLFSRKGMKLPTITAWMMGLSDALLHYWYLWLAAVVLIGLGWFFGRRTAQGRLAVDWVLINLPIIGRAYRKVILGRSIHALGTLLSSSVPLLEALQLTGEVTANAAYERSWQSVKEAVTNGNRISDSLVGNPLFPKTLVQMIAAGEEAGRLDHVLKKVSQYYEGEVETALKAATSLIEPVLISLMGGVVGTIGLSLLLPIFTLSRGAH
ncbi:MAG: type II secretion system F family protein [Pirellulaceae bacterium]